VPAVGAHDGDMTTTPGSASTSALDRFFATLRRSPVQRSRDGVLAGVAAGVADRLGVSRVVIRVAMVALALLGPGVLLYLLAWLLVPDAEGRIRLEGAIRGGQGSSIVLLIVTVLSFFSTLFGGAWQLVPGRPGMPSMYGNGAGLWLLLVLAVMAVIGVKKGWFSGRHGRGRLGQQDPTPSPPRPPAPPASTTRPGPQDAPRA
jgi:phage shock protein PspC (stress-responsive transcriptional regulator)